MCLPPPIQSGSEAGLKPDSIENCQIPSHFHTPSSFHIPFGLLRALLALLWPAAPSWQLPSTRVPHWKRLLTAYHSSTSQLITARLQNQLAEALKLNFLHAKSWLLCKLCSGTILWWDAVAYPGAPIGKGYIHQASHPMYDSQTFSLLSQNPLSCSLGRDDALFSWAGFRKHHTPSVRLASGWTNQMANKT